MDTSGMGRESGMVGKMGPREPSYALWGHGGRPRRPPDGPDGLGRATRRSTVREKPPELLRCVKEKVSRSSLSLRFVSQEIHEI